MPYRQSSGRGCGPWPFPRLCVDALFRRCLKPLFCVFSSRHWYSSTLSIRRHFYLDRYRQRHQKKQKTRKGAWRYKKAKISTYGYTKTEIILGNPSQQRGEGRIKRHRRYEKVPYATKSKNKYLGIHKDGNYSRKPFPARRRSQNRIRSTNILKQAIRLKSQETVQWSKQLQRKGSSTSEKSIRN